MKEKFLQILDKNINQEQLAKDLLMEIVLAEVKEYVAKSPTKIDDLFLVEFEKYLALKMQ